MLAAKIQYDETEIMEKKKHVDVAARELNYRRELPLIPVNHFESVKQPEDRNHDERNSRNEETVQIDGRQPSDSGFFFEF
jgi:hypothetical protein